MKRKLGEIVDDNVFVGENVPVSLNGGVYLNGRMVNDEIVKKAIQNAYFQNHQNYQNSNCAVLGD